MQEEKSKIILENHSPKKSRFQNFALIRPHSFEGSFAPIYIWCMAGGFTRTRVYIRVAVSSILLHTTRPRAHARIYTEICTTFGGRLNRQGITVVVACRKLLWEKGLRKWAAPPRMWPHAVASCIIFPPGDISPKTRAWTRTPLLKSMVSVRPLPGKSSRKVAS